MNVRIFRIILLLGFFTTATRAKAEMKVYISADMEGVVGVVTGDHLGPGGFEYQRAREFLTQEVLTAIEAARRLPRQHEQQRTRPRPYDLERSADRYPPGRRLRT